MGDRYILQMRDGGAGDVARGAGNPTFQYEFTHVPAEQAALGATHASELSHVFGTTSRASLVSVRSHGRPTPTRDCPT